jgi:cobalt/nickel transport system permease protein
MYGLTIVLAAASRIQIGYFVKRVWFAIPFFAGAFILPSILNVVTPGNTILVISRDPFVSVTTEGISFAVILTLRIGIAVSIVTLLTLSTRWNDLLMGMKVLLVPRPFLAIASMTYRYLGVLAQTVSEMFSARQSRSVRTTSLRDNHRFIGRSAGALFGKTAALSEDVHSAMVARCWLGEPRSWHEHRIRIQDLGWLVSAAIIAAIMLVGELIGY